MAVTKYTKSISSDFTGLTESTPHLTALAEEIADSAIATAVDHINSDGTDVDIYMAAALSAGDQTTLNTVVAAHTGAPPNRTAFIESDQIVSGSVNVTEDQTWQEIGGQPTNIQSLLVVNGFEVTDKQYVVGRITCEVKVSGTGAELRVCEDQGSCKSMMTTVHSQADTSGAWDIIKFTTDVEPAAGDATYVLEGRLDGATSMEVRRAAITMLYVGP